MTDTNTKISETKKPAQVEFDVNLFADYNGPRVYTDKRFPNGRIRIYLPAPELNLDNDAVEDILSKYYNKSAQDLLNAGIVQNAYGERDWNNICLRGKEKKELTDSDILANIQKDDGIGPMDADIEVVQDKIRKFFEAAVFTEKRERTPNTTKIVAKKLKAAGVNDISEDEIAAIIAARKAKAAA